MLIDTTLFHRRAPSYYEQADYKKDFNLSYNDSALARYSNPSFSNSFTNLSLRSRELMKLLNSLMMMKKTDLVSPHDQFLAGKLGCSLRTIQRRLYELESKGLIKRYITVCRRTGRVVRRYIKCLFDITPSWSKPSSKPSKSQIFECLSADLLTRKSKRSENWKSTRQKRQILEQDQKYIINGEAILKKMIDKYNN